MSKGFQEKFTFWKTLLEANTDMQLLYVNRFTCFLILLKMKCSFCACASLSQIPLYNEVFLYFNCWPRFLFCLAWLCLLYFGGHLASRLFRGWAGWRNHRGKIEVGCAANCVLPATNGGAILLITASYQGWGAPARFCALHSCFSPCHPSLPSPAHELLPRF